jgi:hypothetical protein
MRKIALFVGTISLWAVALGCGEDTPRGSDLARPARAESTPAPGDPPLPPRDQADDTVVVTRTGGSPAVFDAPEESVQAIDPGRAARD